MDAQDVQRLFKECQDSKVSLVAKRNGMTYQSLLGHFWEFRLLGNDLDDPTPDEIERATKTLRASWTEDTERARWVGSRSLDYSSR